MREGEIVAEGGEARVFDLSFLNDVLHPSWVHEEHFAGASGFSIDSRSLQAGEIFVALRTEKRDGHEFLGRAQESGAAAAIVSDPDPQLSLPQIIVSDPLQALQTLGAAWRQRWGGRVIGVTGSCGKTSTKEMLGLLLGREETYVTPGNLNNFIGIPLCELQLRPHHRRAVLEAGINEGGEMAKLAEMLSPEVAVVTMVGPAHLEKLGSVEGVAREKSVLPSRASERVFLGPSCAAHQAFTEASFAETHWILPQSKSECRPPKGDLWTYALNRLVGLEGCEVHLRNGSDLVFPAPDGTAGMIENACLAIMVAREEGIADDLILQRLAEWHPTAQRGEIVEIGERTIYADCYNANPSSFADAANYFHRRFPEPGRIWVIGGMEELGRSSAAWHRKLAAGLPVVPGDHVFLVGGMSSEMASTLQAKMGEGDRPTIAEDVDAIVSTVLDLDGVIFLKGSRKYRLEKILDSLTGNLRS